LIKLIKSSQNVEKMREN